MEAECLEVTSHGRHPLALSPDAFARGCLFTCLFFRVLNEKEHEAAGRNEHNFDNPEAFDFPLLKETLQRLKEGKKVDVPIYNFVTHRREEKSTSMYGANVLIFEGILAFHDTAVREILGEQRYFASAADGHKLITFGANFHSHHPTNCVLQT